MEPPVIRSQGEVCIQRRARKWTEKSRGSLRGRWRTTSSALMSTTAPLGKRRAPVRQSYRANQVKGYRPPRQQSTKHISWRGHSSYRRKRDSQPRNVPSIGLTIYIYIYIYPDSGSAPEGDLDPDSDSDWVALLKMFLT